MLAWSHESVESLQQYQRAGTHLKKESWGSQSSCIKWANSDRSEKKFYTFYVSPIKMLFWFFRLHWLFVNSIWNVVCNIKERTRERDGRMMSTENYCIYNRSHGEERSLSTNVQFLHATARLLVSPKISFWLVPTNCTCMQCGRMHLEYTLKVAKSM